MHSVTFGPYGSLRYLKKFFALIIFSLIFFSEGAGAENFIELRLPCKKNSQVKAVMPNGEIFILGKVLSFPSASRWPGYTASKWASPSTVCASAVNAIHILLNVEKNQGRIISIIPSETIAPAAKSSASFILDMPAGSGVFGGFAPLTGSKVTLEHKGKEENFTKPPEENDVLIIRTPLPDSSQQKFFMLEIENRPGGRVTAYGKDGPKVVARVVHKLGGVGRFEGTKFQNVGRIRASHSGVIDISTSRRGKIGGFQIMPLKHALTSKEMISAWALTQWLIISPLPFHEDLEGREPIFKNSFLPGPQLEDKLPGLFNQYGRRPLVLCRLDGGDWQRLPEYTGLYHNALKNITHLRIYFPYMQ